MKKFYVIILTVGLMAVTMGAVFARDFAEARVTLVPSFLPDPNCILGIGALVGVLFLLMRRRRQPEEVEVEIDKYTH